MNQRKLGSDSGQDSGQEDPEPGISVHENQQEETREEEI